MKEDGNQTPMERKKNKETTSQTPIKITNKQDTSGRISSGIKNLDELTEGGFETKSSNLIIGKSGSGKSIFAMQFLIEGLRRGENVLYVSLEEKKMNFI